MIDYTEPADDWPRWEDEPLHEGTRPMVCLDCWRPLLYEYGLTEAGYHHAVTPELGCWLLGPEDRPEDPGHPLWAAWHVLAFYGVTSDPYHLSEVTP